MESLYSSTPKYVIDKRDVVQFVTDIILSSGQISQLTITISPEKSGDSSVVIATDIGLEDIETLLYSGRLPTT